MSDRRIDPHVELDHFTIDPRSVRLLSFKYCLQNYVVILDVVDPKSTNPITVGMLDPAQSILLEQLRNFLKREIRAVQLNDYEIRKALEMGYAIQQKGAAVSRLELLTEGEITFDPDISNIQLLNEILGCAVLLGATDVHIENYEDDVDVRVRVDGIMQHLNTPVDKENIKGIVNRLKILANLDIAEKYRAQDGRVRALYETDGRKRNIDLRLSVVPGPFGEDAVMRILDSGKPLISLEDLGFSVKELQNFEELISSSEGMLLVTGPTGSGKTTTLYAGLNHINTIHNKILTAEDPIEYSFPKVNQKQVSAKMGFADFARAFLRQNPDIILIGEVRDEDTADIAIRAAQTGHLVLSTLHTNDSVSAISRLETLGIDRDMIAACLLGVISQRLVRKICANCKYEVAGSDLSPLKKQLAGDKKTYLGRGCDLCLGSGYKGRIGVYELFVVNSDYADMIAHDRPVHEIRRRALERGMVSILQASLEKVWAGITSIEEVLRVIPYRIIAAETRSTFDE